MAGLASAIRCAKMGATVTVLESRPSFGGKMHEINRGKYRFDAGPSLFTMPALVEELLETSAQDFSYFRLANICNYWFSDGTTFQSDGNKSVFITQFAKQFGEAESTITEFLEFYQKTYEITAPVFLEQSLHIPKNYLRFSVLKGLINLWRLKIGSTMHEVLQRKFKNANAIQFFERFATYNGSNPYSAPATLNVISQLEINGGAYLPSNGINDIAKALYQKAIDLGVKFQFNTSVTQIELQNSVIKSVKLSSGENIECEAVFSNADVKKTYTLLPNLELPQRNQKAENSSSAIIFYWGIKKSFKELDLHNIFFSENYKQEFDFIFNKKSICNDPTIYLNITSKFVKNDAPYGCENWFVMVNAPANYGQDWEKIRQETKTNIINKLNKILNVNLFDLIEEEEFLDPVKIEQQTGSDKGSLYGSSSNSLSSAFARHPNFSSKIKGLYFCGGSVHPGGGIPLALLSAKIAADVFKSKQLKK